MRVLSSFILAALLATAFIGTPIQAKPVATSNHESTLQDEDPVIMFAIAGNLPRGRVQISGVGLDDESLVGCVAYIRAPGINKTALIDADGVFSTTFIRRTAKAFTVIVTVVDVDGNASDPVEVLVPAR